MRMSIAPKFSADQLVGVREALDGLVMRYVSYHADGWRLVAGRCETTATERRNVQCPGGIEQLEVKLQMLPEIRGSEKRIA